MIAPPPASKTDLVKPDPRAIDAAVIAGLYERPQPLFAANLGALLLVTAALWGSVDHAYLLGWAAVLTLWTLLRYDIARAYKSKSRSPKEARNWILIFAAGSCIAGCLWGASAWLMDSLDGERAYLVQAFMMAALSAAAIAGYSNSLLAFAAFFTPAILPFAIRLIYIDGTPDPMTAAFVVFWFVLMWIMARHLNDGLRRSLALSQQNAEIAARYRAQRDRAEAANVAKSRFLGHMSHELRTPLNAVLGYADMMREEVFGELGDPRYRGYVTDIHKAGGHLLRSIDQILEIAAIENGQGRVTEQAVDLAPLIDKLVVDHQAQAEAAGVSLHVRLDDDLPVLWGDPVRLRQVIASLIDNGIRFTPSGGSVTISAKHNKDAIEIEIADTGIGMAQEDVRRVLLPFGRAEGQSPLATTTVNQGHGERAANSMGLSLTLAKLLTQAQGAALRLESAIGEGTRVVLDFPIHPQDGAQEAGRQP